MDIPNWIETELWLEFMDIRKKKKAVNSDRAIRALIKKLELIRDRGGNPNEAIERSVIGSWKDIYDRTETRAGKGSITAAARKFEGY